ncbi:hypothetical protein, partial [Lactococcus lactis]|uniref:hypothetical protein n=1 Tax=Lactococcus lactis TaxID=1358 RepID=UPI003D11533B
VLIILCLSVASAAGFTLRREGRLVCLPRAILSLALAIGLGCALVWGKSALVGTPAIPGPMVANFRAVVLDRQELTAQSRIRLILGLRLPGDGRAV